MTLRLLTGVTTNFARDRINVWLRFGRVVRTRQLDRRRRLTLLAPHSVFALMEWQGGRHGMILSQATVMRAVTPGEASTSWPHVRPGAELLLTVAGSSKVEQVLTLIDAIEAVGIDPADTAPEYWRHAHNRLQAHQPPRLYTDDQHAAWLRRRELTS